MYVRIGVKNDMSLHALEVKAYINQGAYHTRLGGLGNQATHVYKTQHVRTEQYRVHTNIPNTGPTRGVGDPQETFGIESAIDEIAVEMGWDPMEFRLKNISDRRSDRARWRLVPKTAGCHAVRTDASRKAPQRLTGSRRNPVAAARRDRRRAASASRVQSEAVGADWAERPSS